MAAEEEINMKCSTNATTKEKIFADFTKLDYQLNFGIGNSLSIYRKTKGQVRRIDLTIINGIITNYELIIETHNDSFTFGKNGLRIDELKLINKYS